MGNKNARLGIAQIQAAPGDLEGNLGKIIESVDRADAQDVDHLVLPELALTGYLVDKRFSEAAIQLNSEPMSRLRELSHRMDLSLGFIEETPSSLFYNSAVYLTGGKIGHIHRKVYLPTYGVFDERRYFGAGWDVSAFDTAHGRMALLICGDAWHLPLAYIAAHDGADVLIIVAASSKEGLSDATPCEDAWNFMCRSYALSLSCFVAFANHAGAVEGHHFWGGSFVTGPDGNLLAQSGTDGPDLVVADLDFNALRHQRIKLPFRRDDSIMHTIQLAQRVLKRKTRRDRFFDPLVAEDPPAPKPR